MKRKISVSHSRKSEETHGALAMFKTRNPTSKSNLYVTAAPASSQRGVSVAFQNRNKQTFVSPRAVVE
ncbi:hypothetical protein COP1_034797 [Malus domestica]